MGSNIKNPKIVHFGDCILDLDTAELRRNGTTTSLQSQPFQILTGLLENPGQLVTREELTMRLWPTGTFVDFDQSLNKAVARLRDALGDNAEKPLYIETLSRRGYRFVAPVERSIGEIGEASGIATRLLPVSPKRLGLALVLLAVVGAIIWLKSRNLSTSPLPSGEPLPVAAYHGNASEPSLSPDGDRVAFVVGKRVISVSIRP